MVNNAVKKGRIAREAVLKEMKSVQSKGRPVHVISHEHGWAVTKEGACRAAHIFVRKVDAVQRARALVKQGAAAYLIVHTEDGSIETVEGLPQEEACMTSPIK